MKGLKKYAVSALFIVIVMAIVTRVGFVRDIVFAPFSEKETAE